MVASSHSVGTSTNVDAFWECQKLWYMDFLHKQGMFQRLWQICHNHYHSFVAALVTEQFLLN